MRLQDLYCRFIRHVCQTTSKECWISVLWDRWDRVRAHWHQSLTCLAKNKDCLWPAAAPRSICNAWWWKHYGFGLLLCLEVWPASHHWVNPEFHTEQESSWGECETICPKAEAVPQVDITITRQWPETLKKIHKWIGQNEEMKGYGITKSRPTSFHSRNSYNKTFVE